MGSSVKDGNVNQPGSPQQCRSAIGPSFSTQYCQVFLKQVNANKNLNDRGIVSYREKPNIVFSCYSREQHSILWVFVFLTHVGKMMWSNWCSVVSVYQDRFSAYLSFSALGLFSHFPHMVPIFPIERLQLNQKPLLSPLPPILTNQSSRELIMTHCMADAVALDASDIACMSVY